MILARVIGTVVTTVSTPDYKDHRLLVVQPLVMAGDVPNEDFIALDNTQAGVGDVVIINREGNGNRQALRNPASCVNSLIVAIVDSVEIAG